VIDNLEKALRGGRPAPLVQVTAATRAGSIAFRRAFDAVCTSPHIEGRREHDRPRGLRHTPSLLCAHRLTAHAVRKLIFREADLRHRRTAIDEGIPSAHNAYGAKVLVETALLWMNSARPGLRSLRYFTSRRQRALARTQPETHLIPLILEVAQGSERDQDLGTDYPTPTAPIATTSTSSTRRAHVVASTRSPTATVIYTSARHRLQRAQVIEPLAASPATRPRRGSAAPAGHPSVLVPSAT